MRHCVTARVKPFHLVFTPSNLLLIEYVLFVEVVTNREPIAIGDIVWRFLAAFRPINARAWP